MGFFEGGGKVECGTEPRRLRNCRKSVLAGSKNALGAREAGAQEILPGGKPGLLSKDTAEVRVTHAKLLGKRRQIDLLHPGCSEVILGAAHDRREPGLRLARIWKLRAMTQQPVCDMSQFGNRVWTTPGNDGVEHFKVLFHAGGRRAVKKTFVCV